MGAVALIARPLVAAVQEPPPPSPTQESLPTPVITLSDDPPARTVPPVPELPAQNIPMPEVPAYEIIAPQSESTPYLPQLGGVLIPGSGSQIPGVTPYPANFVPPAQPLDLIDFRNIALGEAMRTFSEQSGMNIVPSVEANKMQVNLFLRNVRPMDVLDSLTKTHDLYYRIDEASGIIRIYTTQEYEANLKSFREEQTQVFTLLYPNPVDVAVAIRDLFGQRVNLNFGVGDEDSILDLVFRLNRFDLIDSRSLGLGSFQGTYALGGRRFSSLNGLGGFTSSNMRQQFPTPNAQVVDELSPLRNLSAEQIQQLIEAVQARQQQAAEPAPLPTEDAIARLLEERQATIYVTVVRRNNQVVVRTSDDNTMRQIAQLIARLDVPTPLVLLEVKVMSVLLDDQFRSVFDFQYSDGGTSAGTFTTGDILPTPSDDLVGDARRLASMLPGGSVLNQGDLTFQVVSNSFRARMQLLEDDNRVTVLNTPLLLTANNEVSRIFIGDTIPFTIGFNSPQVITGGNNNTTIASTPITELRDVGQSLLITPAINADRTVTLRIVQENARRVINGARIPVANALGGISNQEVDTVNRSTVSGTIVAKDGLAVALGGLIEDEVSDSREKVPVLGSLPGLGFFFRRQATGRTRRELIVMIRPYVFNTPAENAALSAELVQQLSVHPAAFQCDGNMNTFSPNEAIRAIPDDCPPQHAFLFHNVVPRVY